MIEVLDRGLIRPLFERTAYALEQSAAAAEANACRQERANQHDIARDERRRAAWARTKARRARERATRR